MLTQGKGAAVLEPAAGHLPHRAADRHPHRARVRAGPVAGAQMCSSPSHPRRSWICMPLDSANMPCRGNLLR